MFIQYYHYGFTNNRLFFYFYDYLLLDKGIVLFPFDYENIFVNVGIWLLILMIILQVFEPIVLIH